MTAFASLCFFLYTLCAESAWASETEPFALRLATNGDVSLGGGDAALGLRIHKEGWTGTITGEPIWEERSGRGLPARGGALGERALPDGALPVGAGLRAARDDDESAGEPPAPPETPFRMKDDSGAVCVTGRVALVPGPRLEACGSGVAISRSPSPSGGLETAAPFASRSCTLCLRATALSPIRAECVAMEFTIPARDMAGLAWRAGDAANGVFPEKYGEMHLWRGRADSFSYVDPATRKPVELRFPQPMSLLLQDSRLWGPNFSVRVELPKFGRFVETSLPNEVSGRDAPTARPLSFDCEISHPDGIVVERDEIAVIKEGEDWIALENRKNIIAGSALDFSFLSDAPAGKFGWLKAVRGHFEFEGYPGAEQRFYGVNLCDTANFPDHAMSEELVARLKRLGYNSIRFHHHDEKWKNALSARAGRKGVGDEASGRVADDEIDRFDYLAAVAMENGLYLTTDLYVSRKVSWRDIGFDRDGFVPNNVFKSLVALHEPAFENWKAFAEAFLLHENPYTGRRYIDEPGMPLLCLVNEGPMKWAWNGIKKMDCVKEKWSEWREEKCSQNSIATIVHKSSLRTNDTNINLRLCVEDPGEEAIPADPSTIDNFADSAAAQCFAAFVEREAFARERAFLESLGCKALLTSQNCSDDQTMAYLRETYDYVDNHCYLDHPKFLGKLWSGAFRLDPGGNPVKIESGPLVNAAFTRIAGKPYTLTEWNLPGPGQYRGVGGLLMGAMSARQDWDGLWRFAYSHVERGLADGFGAPHLFDLSVDPVNLASERAVMCLFLRGDMAPLETRIALDVGVPQLTPDGKPAANRPEWMDEAWRLQVGRIAGERPLFTNDNCHNCSQIANINSAPPVAPQDTPDFAIDREAGTVVIATPRTCGVFAEGGAHTAGVLNVTFFATKNAKIAKDNFDFQFVDNGEHLEFVNNSSASPKTVWASSLDGEPLETSSRILVTHLTDAQAKGNVFADRVRSILLKWGKGRTLVLNGAARVSLALDHPESCEVWGLATDGTRMERVHATAENGHLSFTADVDSGRGARLFYEIWRTP